MRRLLAAALLLSAGALAACVTPPVRVVTPLEQPLGDAELSLQVTAEPSFLGAISPNRRAAKWLHRRIKNGLLERGFVLRPSEAELYLWVHVEKITTGGSGSQAKCVLRVSAYEDDPGDLSSERRRAAWNAPARFEWEVEVVRKQLRNGATREQLAQETQQDCAQVVIERIAAAR